MCLSQVSRIPYEVFSRAQYLSKLNMINNHLTALPLDIATWKSMVELHLNYNQLTRLPDEISELLTLQVRRRRLPLQLTLKLVKSSSSEFCFFRLSCCF